MDIIQLYQDFSIDYATEGHKHCRPGYVNTPCPFCTGNPGYHLSYNLQYDYYICWRCGWKPTVKAVSTLLRLDTSATYALIKQYGLKGYLKRKAPEIKMRKKSLKFPRPSEPLTARHRKYLEDRNFDPEKLEDEWNLTATGVLGRLDGVKYKNRILIPFWWNGEVVSFNTRDITNSAQNKYMACPKERELVEHKKILYGNQEKWTDTGIVLEGPTDVWRLGPRACATSGIKYTEDQVRVLSTSFKRVAVVFDAGIQEKKQAKKLVKDLKFYNVDAFRIEIEGDPGAMKQSEADYLIKQIGK